MVRRFALTTSKVVALGRPSSEYQRTVIARVRNRNPEIA